MYLVCNRDHKYALAFSAKVASSLLQSICAILFSDTEARYHFGFVETINRMSKQAATDFTIDIINYKKILITRDPFERVLSAYYNKIVSPHQNFTKSKFASYYHAISNKRINHERFNNFKIAEADLDLTAKVSIELSFEEFVYFLKVCKIENVRLFHDPHFEKQLQIYQQLNYTKKLKDICDWPHNFGELLIKNTPSTSLKQIKLEAVDFKQQLFREIEWMLPEAVFQLHADAIQRAIFEEPIRKKTNKNFIGTYCGSLKPADLNILAKNKNNGCLPDVEDMLNSEIINNINFLYENEFNVLHYDSRG